jgi:CO dehydrogenase maturation factor
MHLVFNRYKTGIAPAGANLDDPLGVVPYDPAVEAADLAGTPVSLIPDGSPAKEAVREIAIKMIEFADKKETERVK